MNDYLSAWLTSFSNHIYGCRLPASLLHECFINIMYSVLLWAVACGLVVVVAVLTAT